MCYTASRKLVLFAVWHYFWVGKNNKTLTGPTGNSEFCFPSISGKQISLFPLGPVIKCLLFCVLTPCLNPDCSKESGCLVPVRLSPRPSRSIRFGDVSEANGRGKPRQNQAAHAFVSFCKMADFTGLYKILQTAANYGFKTLVDACVIVDRLLPSLQTPENVMHGQLAIDFSSCKLIPTEHYAEFVSLKTFGDGNCCFRAASLMLFGT